MPPKRKVRAPRAPNLTDDGIERIVILIDAWVEPKLTWASLIEQIRKNLGVHYTRQALDRHTRISVTFKERKNMGRGQVRPTTQKTHRITLLEAENIRLKRENHLLLEQFQRWLYNAPRINLKLWEEDWRQHREDIRMQLDMPLDPAPRRGVVKTEIRKP